MIYYNLFLFFISLHFLVKNYISYKKNGVFNVFSVIFSLISIFCIFLILIFRVLGIG